MKNIKIIEMQSVSGGAGNDNSANMCDTCEKYSTPKYVQRCKELCKIKTWDQEFEDYAKIAERVISVCAPYVIGLLNFQHNRVERMLAHKRDLEMFNKKED